MQIPVQTFRDVSEGIIQKIDEKILPPNSVYLSVNFLYDTYTGRADVRAGTTLLGPQVIANKATLGLFQFMDTDTVPRLLSVFNNAGDTASDIYKLASDEASWSTVKTGAFAANAKVRGASFLSTVVMVDGTSKWSSADGSSWVSTGGNLDVGNMPAGNLIIEFKSRVYVAGVTATPDRLFFSSTPASGTVNWTSSDAGYLDVEPEEGTGPITALAKVPGYLLIFKERSLKRWDGQSLYPESLITVGTLSQESVIFTRQSVFYFNQLGIFETVGGYPRKISRRIQDIIEAIDKSYLTSVTAWGDGDRVYFSIGDVTVDGFLIKNCVIAYSLDSQNWAVLSFPNRFVRWASYVNPTTRYEYRIAGDTVGNVWKVLDGVGDGPTKADIKYMLQLHPQEFGERGRVKQMGQLAVFTKRLKNGSIMYRTETMTDFENYQPFASEVQELSKSIAGRVFEFRVTGEAKSGQFIGLEFPNVNMNLNYV